MGQKSIEYFCLVGYCEQVQRVSTWNRGGTGEVQPVRESGHEADRSEESILPSNPRETRKTFVSVHL